MAKKLAHHIGSILVVALIFGTLIVWFRAGDLAARSARGNAVRPYLSLPIDYGNPLHRALFRETLSLFRPDSAAANIALLRAIDAYRQSEFTDPALKTGGSARGLTAALLWRLGEMYASFVLVFVVSLLLTMYGAQSLGVYRFVVARQGKDSLIRILINHLRHRRDARWTGKPFEFAARATGLLGGAALKGIGYLVLFSPAYVIGYALKTQVETDSLPFMIFLGVVSNGLLITYANRFSTLMAAESRKGYVETAVAKGLSRNWSWNTPGGIRVLSLVWARKRFPAHVLGQIYLNARHEYFPAVREQASFLITGLIIAEMALNIQGHLGYELLQRILDLQYDVVLAIAFAIFVVVKVTDIAVDWQWTREIRRYENIS